MTRLSQKVIEIEDAIRTIRDACQYQSATESLSQLVQQSPFIAQHCTDDLFQLLLNACDATIFVESLPKKLSMLNASWKILLTILTHESVSVPMYTEGAAQMLDQLRWGVLSHDWTDKRRIRLAAFFASHVTSAVRAHPKFFLRSAADVGAASPIVGFDSHLTQRSLVRQLMELYLSVCVAVATSEREDEAVRPLHDHILVRMGTAFECLGAAAATVPVSPGRLFVTHTEHAPLMEKRESSMLHLLRDAVEAANTVATAKVGGEEEGGGAAAGSDRVISEGSRSVRMEMSSAIGALNAHLCIVRGAMEVLSSSSSSSPPASVLETSSRVPLGGTSLLATVSRLLLLWAPGLTPETVTGLGGHIHHHRSDVDGEAADMGPGAAEQSYRAEGEEAVLLAGVRQCASWLPEGTFTGTAARKSSGSAVGPTAVAYSDSLRGQWVRSLAAVWELLLKSPVEAEPSGGEEGDGTAAATVSPSVVLTTLMSASVASERTTVLSSLILEVWAATLEKARRSIEGVLSADSTSTHSLLFYRIATVVGQIRICAVDVTAVLLHLSPTSRENFAVLQQWLCAMAAIVGSGEALLGRCFVGWRGNDGTFVDEERPAADRVEAEELFTTLSGVVYEQIHSSECVSIAASSYGAGTDVTAEKSGSAWGQLQQAINEVLAIAADANIRVGASPLPIAPSQLLRLWKVVLSVPRALGVYRLRGRGANVPSSIHTPVAVGSEACLIPDPYSIKQDLLSISASFASLTQVLQYLSTATPQDPSSRTSLLQAGASQSVGRCAAAALLREVAVLPFCDAADDAVLVACIRRWIGLAFPPQASSNSTFCPSDKADAVATWDAITSLLAFIEECTSLPMQQLHLSEEAATLLMTTLREEGEEGRSSGVEHRLFRRMETITSEERQWQRTKTWLEAQSRQLFSPSTASADITGVSASDSAQLVTHLTRCEATLAQLLPLCAYGARNGAEMVRSIPGKWGGNASGVSEAKLGDFYSRRDGWLMPQTADAVRVQVVDCLQRIASMTQEAVQRLSTSENITNEGLKLLPKEGNATMHDASSKPVVGVGDLRAWMTCKTEKTQRSTDFGANVAGCVATSSASDADTHPSPTSASRLSSAVVQRVTERGKRRRDDGAERDVVDVE